MTDRPAKTALGRWLMCGRKKDFRSKRAANSYALSRNLRTYECPICFCWHVTKKEAQ